MTKLYQIGLVSAISIEISHQYHGIKITQKQLTAIIQAADAVVAAFDEPDLCHICGRALSDCQHLGDK